jgi:hypothetical protein
MSAEFEIITAVIVTTTKWDLARLYGVKSRMIVLSMCIWHHHNCVEERNINRSCDLNICYVTQKVTSHISPRLNP